MEYGHIKVARMVNCYWKLAKQPIICNTVPFHCRSFCYSFISRDKMGNIISLKMYILQGYGTNCYICIIAVIITEYMYGKCMHRVASYKNTEHLKNEQHPWVCWRTHLQSSETVVVVSSLSQESKNKNLASSAN